MRFRRPVAVATIVMATILSMPVKASAQEVIFMIRHAERDWSSDDAGLLDKGHLRAENWARVFTDADLDVVITSEMVRTKQTGAPIAEALEIPSRVFTRYDITGLIELLKAEHADDRVLLVSHSSVIPKIIVALGSTDWFSIPKSDYNDVFVVRPHDDGTVTAVRLNAE